jgi:hypothetical protein
MFMTPASMAYYAKYLQTVFLSLATFVFLASFALPGSLTKFQIERYEAALDDTKPAALRKAIDSAKKPPT